MNLVFFRESLFGPAGMGNSFACHTKQSGHGGINFTLLRNRKARLVLAGASAFRPTTT